MVDCIVLRAPNDVAGLSRTPLLLQHRGTESSLLELEQVLVIALINNSKVRSCCGSAETNPTRNHEVVASIPDLAQWVKDPALL